MTINERKVVRHKGQQLKIGVFNSKWFPAQRPNHRTAQPATQGGRKAWLKYILFNSGHGLVVICLFYVFKIKRVPKKNFLQNP